MVLYVGTSLCSLKDAIGHFSKKQFSPQTGFKPVSVWIECHFCLLHLQKYNTV